MHKIALVLTIVLLVLLTPACAAAPDPQGAVVLGSDPCGPVLRTELTGIPVPETPLVADLTVSLRYDCPKPEVD